MMSCTFIPATPFSPHHRALTTQSASPRRRARFPRCTAEARTSQPPIPQRDQLFNLVTNASSRTANYQQLAPLITALESLSQTNTATDGQLLGTWRNVHTTTPSSSSIIQRTVVSSFFVPRVEQVIHPHPSTSRPHKILNRVDLRNLLGCVLNVRASVEHVAPSQLTIRFDRAWFAFDALPAWLGGAKLPGSIEIPYPVPFKLLGDKACGWLQITYLDNDLRISRGNRGSCFVLVRESEQALPLTGRDMK